MVLADGSRVVVPDAATPAAVPPSALDEGAPRSGPNPPYRAEKPTALGSFVHARSGDKGGDANLGLWVTHDDPAVYPARMAWLLGFVTEERVRALVPEAAELDLDIVPLPELGGVNVVLHGLLGLGVAASARFDPQAKGLGEWVRSRVVPIPEDLL